MAIIAILPYLLSGITSVFLRFLGIAAVPSLPVPGIYIEGLVTSHGFARGVKVSLSGIEVKNARIGVNGIDVGLRVSIKPVSFKTEGDINGYPFSVTLKPWGRLEGEFLGVPFAGKLGRKLSLHSPFGGVEIKRWKPLELTIKDANIRSDVISFGAKKLEVIADGELKVEGLVEYFETFSESGLVLKTRSFGISVSAEVGEYVDIKWAEIDFGHRYINAEGYFSNKVIDINFWSDKFSLADVGLLMPKMRGEGRISGRIYGELTNPVVVGYSELKDYSLENVLKPDRVLSKVVYHDYVMKIQSAYAFKGNSRFSYEGYVDFNTFYVVGYSRFPDVRVEDVLDMLEIPLDMKGEISGDFRLYGYTDELKAVSSFRAGHFKFMGEKVRDVEAEIEFAFEPFKLFFKRIKAREENGGEIFAKGEISNEVNLRLLGRGIPIADLELLPFRMGGVAAFTGRVKGDISAPILVMDTTAQNVEIRMDKLKLAPGRFRGVLKASEDGFTIKGDVMHKGGIFSVFALANEFFSLSVEGKGISLNMETEAKKTKIDLVADLRTLSKLFGVEAGGDISFKGYIEEGKGLYGEFSGSSISFLDIENARISAKVRGEEVEVEEFSGILGGGVISGRGSISQQGLAIETSISSVNLSFGDSYAVVSGNVLVHGDAKNPVVSGDIYIESAVFKSSSSYYTPTLLPILDIKADVKEVFVESELLKLVLSGYLELSGPLDKLAVSGELKPEYGEISFGKEEFSVSSGRIFFVEGKPFADIDSSTSVNTEEGTVDIKLRVAGPVDNPSIFLSSTPAKSEEDILCILAYGSTCSLASVAGKALEVGGEVALRKVSKKMSAEFERFTGFKFEPSIDSISLTRSLDPFSIRLFSGRKNYGAEVKYSITGGLGVRALWDSESLLQSPGFDTGNLGVDLYFKARF